MKIRYTVVGSGDRPKAAPLGRILLMLWLILVASCKLSSSAISGKDGLDSLLNGSNYVPISPGSFLMGSPEPGKKAYGGRMNFPQSERPQHRVLITRPFEIGKYEVTQFQWEAVMGSNPSAFKGTELPVTNISWNDVQQFLKRLQASDSQYTYRLPTEAEWEYACRAGSTGHFAGEDFESVESEKPQAATGKGHKARNKQAQQDFIEAEEFEKNLREVAWYDATSFNHPHPVGKLKPNAWGLYDTHGNVSEWCQDWFDPRFYQQSPAEDPTGPQTGNAKVNRGGNWQVSSSQCRSAARGYDTPHERNHLIGFRLVRIKASPN